MKDPETTTPATSRLEHFVEQARCDPPLKTAVADAGEVHVLEGLLKAKSGRQGFINEHPDLAVQSPNHAAGSPL